MEATQRTQKVVLITGASSGIGKETAKMLLGPGYAVFAAARHVEQMEDLERLGAIPLGLDVTKEEDLISAVSRIEERCGGVDVLVNNAGHGCYGAVEDTALDDARNQFEVNLFGLARLTQLVLPRMRERRAGRIVNVSSMGGKIYAPLGAWYHATKHALEGWSDCLRLELARFGIEVIVVEPGTIRTGFADAMLKPMMGRSGGGAYSGLAKRLEEVTRDAFEKGRASPPGAVAAVIAKAIRARRPRTRYAVGKYAKLLIFLRKWLGDRLFDRMVMSAF